MTFFIRTAAIAALMLVPVAAQRATKPTEEPAQKPAQKSTPKAPTKSSPPTANTLPAGAEKIGDYKWKHKDAAGKTWVYVQTPFGFSKVDEETYRRQEAERLADGQTGGNMVRVVDQSGDPVTFEMTTPFGKQRWQKKRAELSDKEKAALAEAEQAKSKEQ